MIAQFDGYFTGMTMKKDKSWKLTIDTQELSPEAVKVLTSFNSEFIKILMTDEGINDAMIKDFAQLEAELKEEPKTPSERLRAVLWLYWNTLDGDEDFDSYYKKLMEKFIQHYKDKLT